MGYGAILLLTNKENDVLVKVNTVIHGLTTDDVIPRYINSELITEILVKEPNNAGYGTLSMTEGVSYSVDSRELETLVATINSYRRGIVP